MRKKKVLVLAAIVAAVMFFLSIGLSWQHATDTGHDAAVSELTRLTSDVLRHSARTRAQIDKAVDALSADTEQVCSPRQSQVMRKLVLGQGYLQGLGYVENGILLCSTLSSFQRPVAIGPPDDHQPDGFHSWSAVVLPGFADIKFNLTGANGYVAIIAPELIVDLLDVNSRVSLAQIGMPSGSLFRARGVFKPDWLDHYEGTATTFSAGDYLVQISPSGDGLIAALAAFPIAQVDEYVAQSRRNGVPMGALIGLTLAAAVGLIAKWQLSFKEALRAAIANREFFMLYQPVVDLRSGKCTGAEALMRWRQPDGTLVSPVVFIPAAEAAGMIQHVTAHVMELVARDAVALIDKYPDVHIAINLSAEDLQSPGIETRLKNLVQQLGATSDNILIEATERGLMSPDKAKHVLLSIRAQGFKVAIDDFGTGNSSLSYLATYELDFLKIDKMFVDALGTDLPSSQMAFHIIEIAKSLGLEMIAEGVETEAQRDILRGAGVQYAQGWIFGKPMPMADLAEFMRDNKALSA